MDTGEAVLVISRGQGGQDKVYSRNKIGLELIQVDVQGSIEAKRGRDRGDDLGDQTV
jgi:hypothetical protein